MPDSLPAAAFPMYMPGDR